MAQAPRVMEITTPLGADVLLFNRMNARDELSRLSEYQIGLLSKRSDVNLDEIMGKNVTVKLELPAGKPRFFNGYVTRFAQMGTHGSYYAYHATVRPWLWFLTRRSNCRLFQEETVPEIIKKIFEEHKKVVDVKFELSATYSKWEFCVQYRESDFNFVSRLMEQEGIYYYFRHTEKQHTLVIADSYTAHSAVGGYEQIPFIPVGRSVRPTQEHITDWNFQQEIQTGRFVMDDFNFKTPSLDLETKTQITRKHEQADLEAYDYPGEYDVTSAGEHYVKTRLEELHTQFEVIQAQGNARGLTVGSLFKLTGHTRTDQNREYLITGATYNLDYSEYESMEGGGSNYSCNFTAMNSKEPFRAQSSTRKPIVQGPQTAIVVGPAGDEIHTDKYGRVKVQFHWDRYGKHDENSSCWMRVSHPWAGKGWGSVSIPRIGQEVIVDFLEGDPDQPIITGRVYNAESMPPFQLPGDAVVSGLKTNTHKGKGYNEMSMNDTAGKEKITIHGQYDMDTTVQHDQTNTVNNKFTEKIKSDASITVTEGKYSHDVATGTAIYHVKSALTENYDATQDTTVNGNITIKSVTGEILIEAAQKITLHTGASSITMESSGAITISGKNIKVIGSDDITESAPKVSISGDAEAKIGVGNQNALFDTGKTGISGAAINSSATGMHEITGAMVKIN